VQNLGSGLSIFLVRGLVILDPGDTDAARLKKLAAQMKGHVQ
jgi:hypothetical protein